MNDSVEFTAAMEAALRLLAKSARSERQIRDSLSSKNFDDVIVERVVERLISRRLLDDPELALSRARKRKGAGFGEERIREELRKLGVDSQSIEAALLEDAADASKWTETTLRRRLEKRPEMTRAAAYRFLATRGFSEDQIEQAVASVFGAEDRFAE